VIPRGSLALSHEAELVTLEVVEEGSGTGQLSSDMSVTLGDACGHKRLEEVEDLGVVEDFTNLAVDITEHEVPLLVQEGVVQAVARGRFHTINEGLGLLHVGLRHVQEGLSVQRVDQRPRLARSQPLSVDAVLELGLGQVRGVHSGELGEVGEGASLRPESRIK